MNHKRLTEKLSPTLQWLTQLWLQLFRQILVSTLSRFLNLPMAVSVIQGGKVARQGISSLAQNRWWTLQLATPTTWRLAVRTISSRAEQRSFQSTVSLICHPSISIVLMIIKTHSPKRTKTSWLRGPRIMDLMLKWPIRCTPLTPDTALLSRESTRGHWTFIDRNTQLLSSHNRAQALA